MNDKFHIKNEDLKGKSEMTGFIIGLFVGSLIGIGVMCLICANGKDE